MTLQDLVKMMSEMSEEIVRMGNIPGTVHRFDGGSVVLCSPNTFDDLVSRLMQWRDTLESLVGDNLIEVTDTSAQEVEGEEEEEEEDADFKEATTTLSEDEIQAVLRAQRHDNEDVEEFANPTDLPFRGGKTHGGLV